MLALLHDSTAARVDVIGDAFNNKVVGPHEQVLRNIVSKRSLERKQTVRIGYENLIGRCSSNWRPLVFNYSDSREPVGLHHERGVRGIDDRRRWGESFINESQEIALRSAVQGERRLIE